jgi:hypothetical protein
MGAWLALSSLLALGAGPAGAAESYFYRGTSGVAGTFYLIGGEYTLYVYAKLPVPRPYIRSATSCLFGGNFDRIWPTKDSMTLGSGLAISMVPYKLAPAPITLQAGLYHLHMATLTTCDWKFIISSTGQNAAGIAPVIMLKGAGALSDTASLAEPVRFYAQYRTDHDARVAVSGSMQIVHEGHVVRTLPLTLGVDAASAATAFTADVRWEQADAKLLGKNTVNFNVKIGGVDFTSTSEFTLTQ